MRRPVLLAAVAAAFAGGAVVAVAADSASVIVACVDSVDGRPRIVSSSADCTAGRETSLSWNAAGPQGATGPTGPQGPAGQTGPKGTTAVIGVDASGAGTSGFDPGGLSAGDLKAYRADEKEVEKAAGQQVVTGKTAAVATCDLVEKPQVPGQCYVHVQAMDYLACPASHPRAVDHSVAPYPNGYTAGTDEGRGVPLKPPFVGYAFAQAYGTSSLFDQISSGQPYVSPSIKTVEYSPPATATSSGPFGQISVELPGAVKLTAFVRGPGYKPVPQAFGVRTYLTCEKVTKQPRKKARAK